MKSSRKPISKLSPKQRERNKLYRRASKEFWAENRNAVIYCPVMLVIFNRHVIAKEVHHLFGKLGPLYWWKPGFKAVSREGHIWIDSHREEARKHGWLAPLGSWNNTKLCTQTETTNQKQKE